MYSARYIAIGRCRRMWDCGYNCAVCDGSHRLTSVGLCQYQKSTFMIFQPMHHRQHSVPRTTHNQQSGVTSRLACSGVQQQQRHRRRTQSQSFSPPLSLFLSLSSTMDHSTHQSPDEMKWERRNKYTCTARCCHKEFIVLEAAEKKIRNISKNIKKKIEIEEASECVP